MERPSLLAVSARTLVVRSWSRAVVRHARCSGGSKFALRARFRAGTERGSGLVRLRRLLRSIDGQAVLEVMTTAPVLLSLEQGGNRCVPQHASDVSVPPPPHIVGRRTFPTPCCRAGGDGISASVTVRRRTTGRTSSRAMCSFNEELTPKEEKCP
jgi:hypothetical protein